MEKQDIILHVDHMTKCFGDLKVLNDISFDVHRGEFLCIVGPTGCGKTTFLNCITGLYDLTGGQILVNGELVDTKKHNIAYIFQEYSTMSWLTVEENVAFGLKMKRMPKDVIKKVEDGCRSAEIGCVDCKKMLLEHMNKFWEPVREKRKELAKKPDFIWDIAKEGDKIKTIRFGQQGVTGDRQPTARQKSFKARHAKNIAKGKMSAAYWANKVKW